MYILDEPTTGLHQHDIKKLLEILHTFVALGNTVVVIEHNLDVIKTADYIVDMGPEGGVKGGNIIAEGKPEDIIKIKGSYSTMLCEALVTRSAPIIVSTFESNARSSVSPPPPAGPNASE